MTKTEKLQIYNLLKTASDSLFGFSSPTFPQETPDFDDDPAELQASSCDEDNKNSGKSMELESLESISKSNCLKNEAEQNGSAKNENSSGKEPEKNSAGQNLFCAKKTTIENINSKISECKRCALCAGRKQAVPGMGAANPLVLVIGEGPGEEEDKQGLPFVGPAGQLLDKMLAAIHLYRNKNCYIANIVKCRPPMNRVPFPEEAAACRPFLDAQIAALKPKAILCAGSTAVKNLLGTSSGVMKLHGMILDYNGIPLVTTWHPSALLRAPENKRYAWEDLKIFRGVLLKIDPSYEKN